MNTHINTPRPVDIARLSLGAAAIARPDILLRLSKGRTARAERITVRVLGGRYAVQSGAGLLLSQARWPRRDRNSDRDIDRNSDRGSGRPWVRDTDAAIDLIHAATMLALAVVAPTHRRLALISAVTAVGFAAIDLQEKLR